MALGLAAFVSACWWVLEMLVGKRIGFYLSCATVVLVASTLGFLFYADLKHCAFAEPPAPFPQCEWSGVFLTVLTCVALSAIPFLVVSTIVLKKWSDTRRKRLA